MQEQSAPRQRNGKKPVSTMPNKTPSPFSKGPTKRASTAISAPTTLHATLTPDTQLQSRTPCPRQHDIPYAGFIPAAITSSTKKPSSSTPSTCPQTEPASLAQRDEALGCCTKCIKWTPRPVVPRVRRSRTHSAGVSTVGSLLLPTGTDLSLHHLLSPWDLAITQARLAFLRTIL